MDCKEFSQYAEGYFNHSLHGEVDNQAEMHAQTCPGCASMIRELESTAILVRALGRLPAPEGFEERLKTRLAPETLLGPAAVSAENSVLAWLRRLGRWLIAAPAGGYRMALRPAVIGLVLCAVVFGVAYTHRQHTISPQLMDQAYLDTIQQEHESFASTNPLDDDSAAWLRARTVSHSVEF
jgi:hypothetical protein